MPKNTFEIPDGFEIIEVVEESAQTGEYIARHTSDGENVKLKITNFSDKSTVTARRYLREYLRCNITFMEELELPGIIRLFDYSDAKKSFWVATQPADTVKLSKRFDFLASQTKEFRMDLVTQLLYTLNTIHNNQAVHRNLSAEGVFLDPNNNIFIGEFGFASFLNESPNTHQATTYVQTIGYLPPEVQNAATFSCDVSCDIFSAGLLTFEILTATPIPKKDPAKVLQILQSRLNQHANEGTLEKGICDAIRKAADPSPGGRFSTADEFSRALKEQHVAEFTPGSSFALDETATTEIERPDDDSATMPIDPQTTATEVPEAPQQPMQTPGQPSETITPLDANHEIWNNRYEIISKIGEGGQAIVYKAFDHLTHEEIAIKTMWSRHRGDRAAINRLKQGAMVARSLSHKYIIRTYGVEQRMDEDGPGRFVFTCMEFIKSRLELSDIIEKRRAAGKKFTVAEALHIVGQLLEALAYAHEHTIHRDVKPGNIMLIPKEEQEGEIDTSDLTKFDIRLIDFGIAKVLSQKNIDVTGKGFRSAHYGAPELGDLKAVVDARADIFSAGVILYQMLTMNIPRKGSPPANKVNKDVPAALAAVIDRSINADRSKRFKTAGELIKEMNQAVSKFHWVRKASKIAAVFVVLIAAAITTIILMPEPDEISIDQGLQQLQQREPTNQIATLANNIVVNYSDIQGYDSYDNLRKTAQIKLETLQGEGLSKVKKQGPAWAEQDNVWQRVAPAVEDIESIERNQSKFEQHKDSPIAEHLNKLEPSAKIVTQARNKIRQAEKKLQQKPYDPNDLNIAAQYYDTAAKVYSNIETLPTSADSPQVAAQQLNEKFANLGELRTSVLSTRAVLEDVKQLKKDDFFELSEHCFSLADNHYNSYSLEQAGDYFNILNQICGTLVFVKDEVNFRGTNIGLICRRLMDITAKDIDTFEQFPQWQNRLADVYIKKDVLNKLDTISTLLAAAPDDVPVKIYDHAAASEQQYRQNNMTAASSEIDEALNQYETYIKIKIESSIDECDSLLTLSNINIDTINTVKNDLTALLASNESLEQLTDNYNNIAEILENEKDTLRSQWTQQASDLRDSIRSNRSLAESASSFWKSKRIGKYISVASDYDTEEIEQSIDNFRNINDLAKIAAAIDKMEQTDSALQIMLLRKNNLDTLASKMDRAIRFCKGFKPDTSDEEQQYAQWTADLDSLRSDLTAKQNGSPLIDQPKEMFAANFETTKSAFLDIYTQLPFHSATVVDLIEQTKTLEENAKYLTSFPKLWSSILNNVQTPSLKTNFHTTRSYLESIKDTVDQWETSKFDNEMQSRCKIFSDTISEQNQAANIIVSAIIDKKNELLKDTDALLQRVNEILANENVVALTKASANIQNQSLSNFKFLPGTLRKINDTLSAVSLNRMQLPKTFDSTEFTINAWLDVFDSRNNQLLSKIEQLRSLEPSVTAFDEARVQIVNQDENIKEFFLALRDSSLQQIDYSNVQDIIDASENDKTVSKMFRFLSDLEDDTLPSLEKVKTQLSNINQHMASLKTLDVATLNKVATFKSKRDQLQQQIAIMNEQAEQLTVANIENTCKKGVEQSVGELAKLATAENQIDRRNRLTEVLWRFFPAHKEWSQWSNFPAIFHVTIDDNSISLSNIASLSLANQDGLRLSLEKIAENPSAVFATGFSGVNNFGWPRNVVHEKDPTVTFAFVPGSAANTVQPFYLATREISNAQYKRFMEDTAAKPASTLAGWSYFSDTEGKLLIGQVQGQFPPSRITWDKNANAFVLDSEFKNAPVTWVTHHGAKSYAAWLDGTLPNVKEYRHATLAGATSTYPWGSELSDASKYAHVRSAAWQTAAKQYNLMRDNPTEIAHAPVGAVKDFLQGNALDPAQIVHSENSNSQIWPYHTNNKLPNTWGLFDLIGNAWEWCIDENGKPTICGGSCLSPPKYLEPSKSNNLQFDAQACDTSFRVAIHAK